MTDEPQPPASPPSLPPLPPPPGSGPFAFPPPPDPGSGAPGWGTPPDQGTWRPRGFFPLDLGRTFELTFSLYRLRWRTLVAIAVPLEMLLAVASLALLAGPQSSLLTDFSSGPPTRAEVDTLLAAIVPAMLATFGFLLATVLLGFVQLGAMTDAVGRIYAGRQAGAWTSLLRALRRWATFLAIMLLFFAGLVAVMFGGLLVGVVVVFGLGLASSNFGLAIFLFLVVYVGIFAALIFIGVRWSMAAQVAMVENVGAVEAMRRSWRLIAGSGWRVIGYYLAFGLLVAVISAIIGTVVNLLINPYQTEGVRIVSIDYTRLAISTALGTVLGAFVAPLSAIPAFLLYLDLRFRRGDHVIEPGKGSLFAAVDAGSVTEEQL